MMQARGGRLTLTVGIAESSTIHCVRSCTWTYVLPSRCCCMTIWTLVVCTPTSPQRDRTFVAHPAPLTHSSTWHGHSRRTGTAKAQLRGARQPHVLRQPAVQRPRSAQACASNGPCIAHRPQEFKAQSRMIALPAVAQLPRMSCAHCATQAGCQARHTC